MLKYPCHQRESLGISQKAEAINFQYNTINKTMALIVYIIWSILKVIG